MSKHVDPSSGTGLKVLILFVVFVIIIPSLFVMFSL